MKPIHIYGEPDEGAVLQINKCMEHPAAVAGALMADHHLGYSLPIGGVIAYKNAISPSGVGYDIACGNKAVRLAVPAGVVRDYIKPLMDTIVEEISFGVGRNNKDLSIEHPLFNDPTWDLANSLGIDVRGCRDLKQLARQQLGTVGSGNHYVDIFTDELDRVWCGVHFGSRGLGHKLATFFIKAGGGKDAIHTDPAVFPTDGAVGKDYIECMELAGRYAYAGRDWVCQKVADLLGTKILEAVHNHHNFAWQERLDLGGRDWDETEEYWVVRKGATPAYPGQRCFVGGSMAENSVILEGVETPDNKDLLYSTVHGAGRVMSRTQAAGKTRWKKGERVRISEGEISTDMMMRWVNGAQVELRGAGVDESPHCYKRLPDVLEDQGGSIRVIHTLKPIGVAMAGANEHDPYKD